MAYKRTSPMPVVEGGTELTATTAYAVLCGGTTSTSALQSIASVGSSGEVLTSNGAGALPTFQAGAANFKQQVRATTTAAATLTTQIPLDDTIPQNTEGDEVITATITPTNASNILLIEFTSTVTSNTSSANCCLALFQDTTAAALSATVCQTNNGGFTAPVLRYYMAAGTTMATTFKIRGGPVAAINMYINSNSSGRVFGGVSSTVLTVTEIQV